MKSSAFDCTTHYLKVSRRPALTSPCLSMMQSLRQREGNTHQESLPFLPSSQRGRFLARGLDLQEIMRRLIRLIQIEADYRESLRAIQLFANLIHTRVLRNGAAYEPQ